MERLPPPEPCRDENALCQTPGSAPHGARLRSPGGRVPGPCCRAERLHRARHPSHEGRRISLSGRRGSPTTSRFVQQSHPPSPRDVASLVNISLRQLERLCVKYIGTSPQKYTRQTQLKHAMKLLEQSSMPIVEVAIACGFRGTSTFNKSFKRAFGVTPIKFRQFGANPVDGTVKAN